LALITFVKKFRQYLLGRKFLVRTDHAALQWLKQTPEPVGQQARWLEILEEFDYDIEHRAGAKHNNADAMSRRPTDRVVAVHDVDWRTTMLRAPIHEKRTRPVADIVEPVDWPCIQKQDADLRFVYNLVRNGTLKPASESITALSTDVKT